MLQAGEQCDDDNTCSPDSCNPAGGCVNSVTPVMGCKASGKSILLLTNDADNSKDALTWKWLKGASLLDTFAPILSAPVTVRLVNSSDSSCLEAVHAARAEGGFPCAPIRGFSGHAVRNPLDRDRRTSRAPVARSAR